MNNFLSGTPGKFRLNGSGVSCIVFFLGRFRNVGPFFKNFKTCRGKREFDEGVQGSDMFNSMMFGTPFSLIASLDFVSSALYRGVTFYVF